MSPEQAAPYGVVALFVLDKAWGIFSTGRKEAQSLDKLVDDKIAEAFKTKADSEHQISEAKQEVQDLKFARMMDDIARISDSMADILRMLRESVATKQDNLQMDARMDASEESHRDHYDSFKKLREEINAMRVSCARYHRTGDTAAVTRDVVR